ncbi:Pr6Pr family membrane protein [Cellulomonas fengjieae]|uniref:Pr6Pr family membrane protein n=1 Tax=Cellulomonas fengjieae TaxID=2819978 RepID=UPI001AAF91D7|nr:Pr6Pr family membrane protein [Cellulomonas fengjieae]MBO3101000.1 Pr6Pr family membrane protein [Cellulomonas fengjieae]
MDVVVALFRFAVAALALIGTQEIWLRGQLDGLLYFTNQSGLLLAVVMVWGGIASLRHRAQPPGWLKGGVTLFLLITGLVATFVLAPEGADAPSVAFGLTSGQIEHQIDPVAAFLDFLLVDAHRRLRLRHSLYWLGYLLAYVALVTVRGLGWPDLAYPYGFVDLGELGWGGLGLNVLLYGAGFWVLGLVIIGIDRLLPARALVGSAGRVRVPA